MCRQTSARFEALHLFTILSNCIYWPIKANCFRVSHVYTMYDAEMDGWKVLESRGVHVPHHFVHVMKILEKGKKKHIDRNPGKMSKDKITCHFRSLLVMMCLLPPTTEDQQVCGSVVKAFH